MKSRRVFAVVLFVILIVGLYLLALQGANPISVAKTNDTTPTHSIGLRYAPLTPEIKAAIDETFRVYYSSRTPDLGSRLPDRSQLELTPLIAQYNLSADNLLSGSGLEKAKIHGYGCYIKSANKIVGELQLDASTNGTFDKQSGRINTIDARWLAIIAPAIDGLANAGALEQIRKGSFELRTLGLPAYDAVSGGRLIAGGVMWLKSESTGNDLIFTFPKSISKSMDDPPGLQPSTVYTVPEMLKLIKPAIQKFQDSPASREPHWTD